MLSPACSDFQCSYVPNVVLLGLNISIKHPILTPDKQFSLEVNIAAVPTFWFAKFVNARVLTSRFYQASIPRRPGSYNDNM